MAQELTHEAPGYHLALSFADRALQGPLQLPDHRGALAVLRCARDLRPPLVDEGPLPIRALQSAGNHLRRHSGELSGLLVHSRNDIDSRANALSRAAFQSPADSKRVPLR